MNAGERARGGEELRVDLAQIERQLSELWRAEGDASEEGVTKAALWNVVAHSSNDEDRMRATQDLGVASASIPQRTIVIRADPHAPSELTSWISANCHLVGGEKQVCSEEISILAGGDRVHHVPSLVNALLLPDMPVATWWIGDLPAEDPAYVANLLEPADRLIVDSAHFDGPDDVELLAKIGSSTGTRPADLNWVRLEEWRLATASMFDAPQMLRRLQDVSAIRVRVQEAESKMFGERMRAILYVAWIRAALRREIPATIEPLDRAEHGAIVSVDLEFASGGGVLIERIHTDRVIVARTRNLGDEAWPTVTMYSETGAVECIVRQLSRRDEDTVFPRVLPGAAALARSL